MVGGHPVLPLGISLVQLGGHRQPPPTASTTGCCCHQGRVGWVFSEFRRNPVGDCHQLEPKCPKVVGHFVNFSEHKTCTRKLHASVNMYPEVKKIPRAQKAACRLLPNAL